MSPDVVTDTEWTRPIPRPDAVSAPSIAQELRELVKQPAGAKVLRTREAADRLLGEVRRRGIARAYPVISTSICTLAAPVFGADGAVTAALVAIGYKSNFDARLDGAVATSVKATALQLSRRLGHVSAQGPAFNGGGSRGKN